MQTKETAVIMPKTKKPRFDDPTRALLDILIDTNHSAEIDSNETNPASVVAEEIQHYKNILMRRIC
jgi:hypothetical protein